MNVSIASPRSSRRHFNKRCKEEEEAGEARTLLDDMQQNVDEADAKDTEPRSRLYRDINEYMHSWDQELGRPQHIMDKMWQMMHSKTLRR